MADLNWGKFFFRSYSVFNWTSFDLEALSEANEPRRCSAVWDTMGGDGTQALPAGMAV